MTQLVQYYWPAGVNDPGHALSLTQVGNGLILPRKDSALAYLFQASGSTYTTTADPVTTVSGMVGGFIDSCTDGTVSGAWLLGAYGDITHVVSGSTDTAYPITGAVSGDTFVANAYVPGRTLPYFAADNGDMVTVVSGAVAACTGWGEAVAGLSSDNTKLYALLPSSNKMGAYTFTSNTAGTIVKTSTPLTEASTIAATAAPGAVAVGGWTNSTLAIGATCFEANPNTTFAATATPTNNHITLISGSEPNWSVSSFVTGTGAPQFLAWTTNGQQLLVTDATNGTVLVLNLIFGQLQFAQQFNVAGAGRISMTPDGVSAIIASPTTGALTVLTNTVGVWSVSQTINAGAGGGVWCETDGDIIVGITGGVNWYRFLSGTWQLQAAVSGLGFTPVDLFADPATDIVYATGGTGTGHLVALQESGVIAATTWSGNARDVYFEQSQICVADDAGPSVRIFSLSKLLGTFTQQATATAPAGCSFIGSTLPSVWVAGTSTIAQDVFTAPFTLVPQRMGAVSFWNGTSFATTQNLLVGHQPSSMVWDAFGSLWVVTIQNDLYRFSSTGTQLLTTSLVPNSSTPAGLFPSLGVSAMLWWLNNLWGVSSLTEAVVQLYSTASPLANATVIAGVATVGVTTRLLNPNATATLGVVGSVRAFGTFVTGNPALATLAGTASVTANSLTYLRAAPGRISGAATVTASTTVFVNARSNIFVSAVMTGDPRFVAVLNLTSSVQVTGVRIVSSQAGIGTKAGVATVSVDAIPTIAAITFNPSDLSNIALTNENLTATATGASGTQSGVRSTSGKSLTGKYYAEFTTTTIQPAEYLGIANSTFSLTNAGGPGYDANAIAVDFGGNVRVSGTTVGAGGSWLWTAGGIVGAAIDYAVSKIWFNINGRWDINTIQGITPGVGSFVAPDGATWTISNTGNVLRNGGATSGIGSGGSTGATLTFSDDFTSHNSSLWFYDSYDDGGDAWWSNDPSLTPQIYTYSNSQEHIALLNIASGGKSFTSGINGNSNTGGFSQQYGYFETTCRVDNVPGMLFGSDYVVPGGSPWPPNFLVPVIFTTLDGVQHLWMYASVASGDLVYQTDSNSGWDGTVMHAYGLNWTASIIEFYVDRALVASWPNPGDPYNDFPVYNKHFCQTNYYPNQGWNGGGDVNPANLPAYAHIDKIAAWNAIPFTVGGGSAASQGILYQGVVYAQAASGGAWYSWNGSVFVASAVTPPAAVTVASDPTTGVGGYSFSALNSSSIATIFILNVFGSSTSFTTVTGDIYRLDGENNAFWTPVGSSEIPIGIYGDVGFNASQMAYYANTTIYIQDSRDSTWHTFNPTNQTFSGNVSAPPSSSGGGGGSGNVLTYLLWGAHSTGAAMSKILNAGGTTLQYLPMGFASYQTSGPPVSAPVVSSSSVTASSLLLTWTATTGTPPVTYSVGWRITGQSSFTSLVTGLVGLSTSVTNLNPNVAYQFQVTAVTGAGSLTSSTYSVTTVNESPNGTTLINTSGSITDANNNSWTLTAGATVNMNGGAIGFIVNVTQIVYWNHTIYALSSTSGWEVWNGLTWVVTTNPVVQSAQGATASNTSQIIVDGTNAWWTLYNTVNSGLAAEVSGNVDNATSSVQLLVYWNHQVYYENATGTWFVYGGTMGSWIQVAGDPRVGLPGQITGLALVSAATTTAAVTWTGPLPGGTLDVGKYQVQYSTSTSYTDNGPALTYCTPSKGSIIDQRGNVWTLNASGTPVINSVFTDTSSTCLWLLLDENGFVWQRATIDSSYWNILPTGTITASGLTANWASQGATGPLANVAISGLAATTTYTLRVYVTNSVGAGAPSSTIVFSTSGAAAQITGISMSNTTILPNLSAGTLVGTATVGMSSGSFTGSLAIGPGTSTYTTGSGPTPPAIAASVGYTTLTATGMGLGSNWFPWTGSNSSQGLTQNSDGSITDSGGRGNSYNAHCISTQQNGAGYTTGVCFGGGLYAECTFSYLNPAPGFGTPAASDGWPSFWMLDPGFNTGLHTEVDFMESFVSDGNANGGTDSAFSSGVIDWNDGNIVLYSGFGGGGIPGLGIDSTASLPGNNNFAQKHKLGCLWVPATASTRGYVQTYFDGVLVKNAYSWTQYNGGSLPVGAGGTAPNFSGLDVSTNLLLWGTGSANPMTVYNVDVWQKDDSKNVRRNVALPSGGGGGGSTTAPVFNISGNVVTTATSLATGNYNLVLIATQSGVTNSPFTNPTIQISVTTTTSNGPAASSSFITADFTSAQAYPNGGSGQQIVSQRMWGVSTGAAADTAYAAFANSSFTAAAATINPGLWRINGNEPERGDTPYFNSNGTVNTATWANLINNFYKADPLGISGLIIGVNTGATGAITGISSVGSYQTAMTNLAMYLNNATMPNGKKLPVIGFECQNEPDGHLDSATLLSYYNAMVTAVKGVNPAFLVCGPTTSFAGALEPAFHQGATTLDVYDWHTYVGGYPSVPSPPYATTRFTSDANSVSASNLKSNTQAMLLGEYNIDFNVQDPDMLTYVGAMFDAVALMQSINGSKVPFWAAIWDAYLNTNAGIIRSDNSIVPGGRFLAQGVRTIYGPRWNVPANSAGLLTLAVSPTAGAFGLMIVNAGQGNRNGTVALSHVPLQSGGAINSSGNGTANVWQQSAASPNGAISTVTVTAGITTSISFPDPSITIISPATAALTVPGAPSGLSSSSQTTTSVSLNWVAPTSGGAPTGYQIQYKLATSGTWLNGPTATVTSGTVSSLTTGTSYNFRVYAFNNTGNGNPSNVLTQSTASSGPTPTFSDNFASFNANLWAHAQFDDGGDGFFSNDPSIIPLTTVYSGGHLNQNLIVTPPGFVVPAPYPQKPFLAGIQDNFNSPRNVQQVYGYFEANVSVDRLPGLGWFCFVVSVPGSPWPPNFAVANIWTDSNNVMQVAQFCSGTNISAFYSEGAWGNPSQPHSYGMNWTECDRILS
jgi:hypothetical protein